MKMSNILGARNLILASIAAITAVCGAPGASAQSGQPPIILRPTFPNRDVSEIRKPAAIPKLGDLLKDENQPCPTMSGVQSLSDVFKMIDHRTQNVKAPPPSKLELKSESTAEEAHNDGARDRPYTVTRKKYSLTSNPEELVTMEPMPNFWVGALVYEEGVRQGLGSTREIPVPASGRAPYTLTLNLPIADPSVVIENPSYSAYQAALGQLVARADGPSRPLPGTGASTGPASRFKPGVARALLDLPPPGAIRFGSKSWAKIVENHSAEQTAIDLGFSVRHMSVSAKGQLNYASSANRQAVSLLFRENAFTVTADFGGKSRENAFFRPDFPVSELQRLAQNKAILCASGKPDAPHYVKSLTYGRIVMMNIVSQEDQESLKLRLQAWFNKGLTEGSLDAGVATASQSRQYELQVTVFGGPRGGLKQVLPITGDEQLLTTLRRYLQEPAPMSTMVPISYGVYLAHDDRRAALLQTTEYTETTYAPNPVGHKYRVNVRFKGGGDDGVGDPTNEVFGSIRRQGSQPLLTISPTKNDQDKTIDIGSFEVDQFFDEGPLKFEAQFYEDDDYNDDIMMDQKFDFDPNGCCSPAGQGSWSQYHPSQNGTSWLYFDVERIGAL